MPIRNPCLLLDTHAWVWAMNGDSRAASLRDHTGSFLVSVLSVWELGMLSAKDRLQLSPSVEEWVETNLTSPVQLQPLTPEIALHSTSLKEFHGDPVDRMLVSTSCITGHPLVTQDRKILSWFAHQPDLRHLVVPLE